MISAIPAPPEWVVLASGVVVSLLFTCGLAVLLAAASRGSRRAGAVLVAMFVLGVLVLVWSAVAHSGERTLTFTLPTHTAKADASGRIVDCSGGAPVKSLAGWRLYAQVQSVAWVAFGDAMNADPQLWADWWPVVSAQAMPRQIRSASTKNLPNGGAGARVTVQAPDSIGGMPVLVYFVTTFNDSLQESCTSNLRGGR